MQDRGVRLAGALADIPARFQEGHTDLIAGQLTGDGAADHGFQAAAAACLGHDALDRLGELTQPALVLAGRHDILTRPELSEELAGVLPHAQLQLLEAGHMRFWETPETWGPAVTHWLDALGWG